MSFQETPFENEGNRGGLTYLGCDMAPVVLATKLFKILLQEGTHADDAIRHALDLAEPLLIQSRIVENLRSNAGAVNWRVGV
jgi:hypothetical protein